MSSTVRSILARLGFQDAGFTAGMNQAAASVGKFGVESALGVKAGGNLAGTLGNLGKTFAVASLGAVGLTGGVAGLALAMHAAVREVGDMQTSMVRLKLATGGNADEFARYRAIIESTPRGGLFDDNDVARAASMARVMELTVDEFEKLLPSIRGLAATTPGASLEGVFMDVARAINTGMIRSLVQYGITQDDVERNAQRFYNSEFKNLDELAQRYATLQAVQEKAVLFQSGEQMALQTLPGTLRSIATEMGEVAKEIAGPLTAAIEGLLRKNAEFLQYRNMSQADLVARKDSNRARLGLSAFFGRGGAYSLAQATSGPDVTIGQSSTLSDAYIAGLPSGSPPGGRIADPAAAQRAAQLRARLLGNLTPDRGLLGEAGDLAGGREYGSGNRKQAEREREARKAYYEQLREDTRHATEERLAMEEQMEQESWARRVGIADTLSTSMYNTISRASLAYYSQEGKRRQSFLSFFVASMKLEAAQHIIGLGMKAAKEAAFHAIKGFARSVDPFTAPFAAGEFAAAAKYGAFAAAAGVAGGALQASAAGDFRRGEEDARGGAIGGSQGNQDSRRGFGLTFTRPIEHLTINVAVSISGTNFIGSDQSESVADMMEQYGVPAVQDALNSGKIAA